MWSLESFISFFIFATTIALIIAAPTLSPNHLLSFYNYLSVSDEATLAIELSDEVNSINIPDCFLVRDYEDSYEYSCSFLEPQPDSTIKYCVERVYSPGLGAAKIWVCKSKTP